MRPKKSSLVFENDFHYNVCMNSAQHPLAETWLIRLQEAGYRLTGPRRWLVDTLAASPRALSPLELYDAARRYYPGMGLVTVYRTLEKLEELGLTQRVHQPDGCHMFLRAAHGHEHLLLCTSCLRADYFSGDDLEALIQAISHRTGFRVDEHWLQFNGLCADCQAASA